MGITSILYQLVILAEWNLQFIICGDFESLNPDTIIRIFDLQISCFVSNSFILDNISPSLLVII